MSQLYYNSLCKTRNALRTGKLTVRQAVLSCFQRIEETDPILRAFISTQKEESLVQARTMDSKGPDPEKPLWGVPVAVKDILCTKGVTTTCGSKILENFVPCYSATAVEKLQHAGAVIIGKTNMDEFAMGSSTESSAYGITANPWDRTKTPGGSSGGSAAAVAGGQCFGALGTDTGGSVRQPASFCGIVGIKPTYGRVSRYGCVAYASSLDQIGSMGRGVEDAALLLQCIAGHDPKDSTSADIPVPDYLAALTAYKDLKGLRLGMPGEYWEKDGLHPEVAEACAQAIRAAQDLGAVVVPVSLPHTAFAVAAYYIIAMAEASSNLARYDGVRYGLRDKESKNLLDMYLASRSKGFGLEVKRRIMLGTYVLSAGYYDAYYRKAAQVRRLIRQDFTTAFKDCDVIVSPASPVTAWGLGEKNNNPLQMYLMDIFTISVNLAGIPGLSLPVGLGTKSKMPVGLQLLAPAFEEERLFSTAKVLEEVLPKLPHPHALV